MYGAVLAAVVASDALLSAIVHPVEGPDLRAVVVDAIGRRVIRMHASVVATNQAPIGYMSESNLIGQLARADAAVAESADGGPLDHVVRAPHHAKPRVKALCARRSWRRESHFQGRKVKGPQLHEKSSCAFYRRSADM